MMAEFQSFGKIARLSREMIVTEKLDGTNAQVYIGEDGEFAVGSRKRWITPEDDNFGFAAWAYEHYEELAQLGPGRHFGEWVGKGIQRNYGLDERRFYLFNVHKWADKRPACCHVVPVLYRGPFSLVRVELEMEMLQAGGSAAVPGFMKPEGVVVYHTAARTLFKKTFEGDEGGKS